MQKPKGNESRHIVNLFKYGNKNELVNAPSGTPNPSGNGRGNNSGGTKGK